MHKAHQRYLASVSEESTLLDFDAWRAKKEANNVQFQYWSITLKFQLNVLIFVRSLREGNFQLYKDALTELVPWFFALDHTNYARWVPIHIRDMISLDNHLPALADEFRKGNFVVHKTHHAFSAIPIDQAHEQNNKCVKGDGGAVGLTENTTQLLRWMISGPEMARVIGEFEASQEQIKHVNNIRLDVRHHEQFKAVQERFMKQVENLCETIEEMGNPFKESSDDLLVLDTHDIADKAIAESVRTIESLGKKLFNSFVSDRLDKCIVPLSAPIKQNKLALFSCPQVKTKSLQKQQIATLKQNCTLFSQSYVSCQVRDGDLDSFFRHENQSYPPSLSKFGSLRMGSKSQLLPILEDLAPVREESPEVDVLLLDGAAIINMLKPGAAKTFKEYAEQVFLPYINRKIKSLSRIDIVWDEYFAHSLKEMTRSKRGRGVR